MSNPPAPAWAPDLQALLPVAWVQPLEDASGNPADPWPFDPDRGLAVRHKIVPDLWPLAVPLDTLQGLPGNPRKGDVQAMRRSLATYGLRKPVVVNVEHGSRPVVEAGNHTLKAAKAEGWTHLAVVRVRDDPDTELGYALADNRVGELGRFDPALLAEATGRLRAADPALLWAAGYTGDERPGAMDASQEWIGMPEYHSADQTGIRLMLRFPTDADAEAFYALVGCRPNGNHNGLPVLWWPQRPEGDRRQFSDQTDVAVDPGAADAPDA